MLATDEVFEQGWVVDPFISVRAFAKDLLAAYKVPKSVEFVDAIPRTEATKVSRAALVDARGG